MEASLRVGISVTLLIYIGHSTNKSQEIECIRAISSLLAEQSIRDLVLTLSHLKGVIFRAIEGWHEKAKSGIFRGN